MTFITVRPSLRNVVWCLLPTILLVTGIVAVVMGAVAVHKSVPDEYRRRIQEMTPLGISREDGGLNSRTVRWIEQGRLTRIQYWFFNYTNTLEIINRGSRPDFIEYGPYTYRIIKDRMIKKWSNNSGELTYRLNETFHFDETYSCTGCSVNDRFLVPNPIYAKFIVLLHDPEALLKTLCEIPETGDALCSLLTTDVLKNYTETYASEIVITTKAFNIDPFISLSVDELLFTGYKDPLFTNLLVTLRNAVKRIMFPSPDDQPPPTFLMFPSPKIILNRRNNTNNVEYTIKTGADEIDKVGEILSFFVAENSTSNSNGSKLPEIWWEGPNSTECPLEKIELARRINGSLGDLYRPYIKETDQLFLYDALMCRSTPLSYVGHITITSTDGLSVNAFRFTVPTDTFDSGKGINCGYCHPLICDLFDKRVGEKCLPNGLLDISHCFPGNYPIVVSYPHFYGSSERVRWLFPRMSGNAQVHATYIDIEPESGTVLRSMKRLQTNVVVARFSLAHAHKLILPGVYPVMWQEEIYTADDKTIRLLNNYLFDYRQHYTAVSRGAGIGLGTFLIVVSVSTIIAFVSIYARNRRKKEATRDVPEATANRSVVLSSSSSDSETRQSFNNRSRSNQEGDCVN